MMKNLNVANLTLLVSVVVLALVIALFVKNTEGFVVPFHEGVSNYGNTSTSNGMGGPMNGSKY